MLGYIVRRILATIPVVTVVAVLVFLLLRLAGGDPAAIIAGDSATTQQVAEIRVKLGLERPIVQQFVIWVGRVGQGDFGESFFFKKQVAELIRERLEPTAALAVCTIVLAVAAAVNALKARQVERILLVRPAVEAGENLGFLPGDIQEKVNPYLRPLYDALYDMMEAEKVMNLMERGVIEIAPLAFMRGRTLNDAFVILDEAQNTTTEQMKMFLTRLGFNSKAVITGDVTQIDLPSNRASGLVEVMKILEGIGGITFVSFSERDVVRHKLVQAIIKAYEQYENRNINSET